MNPEAKLYHVQVNRIPNNKLIEVNKQRHGIWFAYFQLNTISNKSTSHLNLWLAFFPLGSCTTFNFEKKVKKCGEEVGLAIRKKRGTYNLPIDHVHSKFFFFFNFVLDVVTNSLDEYHKRSGWRKAPNCVLVINSSPLSLF